MDLLASWKRPILWPFRSTYDTIRKYRRKISKYSVVASSNALAPGLTLGLIPLQKRVSICLFRCILLHRLLAHTLVEALWDQLLLDVSGSGGVFTLGDTSRLIGSTVAAAVSEGAAYQTTTITILELWPADWVWVVGCGGSGVGLPTHRCQAVRLWCAWLLPMTAECVPQENILYHCTVSHVQERPSRALACWSDTPP